MSQQIADPDTISDVIALARAVCESAHNETGDGLVSVNRIADLESALEALPVTALTPALSAEDRAALRDITEYARQAYRERYGREVEDGPRSELGKCLAVLDRLLADSREDAV